MRRTFRLTPAIAAVLLTAACTVPSTTVKTTPVPGSQAGALPTATTSLAPPKAPAIAKVGNTVDVNGSKAGDKLAITLVKIVDPASADNSFDTPKDGSRYIAVQFRIHNTGTGTYADDPDIDVAAIDSAGQQYSPTLGTTVTAGAKLASNVNVAAGDTVLGFEVFEVPKDQKLAKVQYKLNMGLVGDVAQWSVG